MGKLVRVVEGSSSQENRMDTGTRKTWLWRAMTSVWSAMLEGDAKDVSSGKCHWEGEYRSLEGLGATVLLSVLGKEVGTFAS